MWLFCMFFSLVCAIAALMMAAGIGAANDDQTSMVGLAFCAAFSLGAIALAYAAGSMGAQP